jgi:hypothetical protein
MGTRPKSGSPPFQQDPDPESGSPPFQQDPDPKRVPRPKSGSPPFQQDPDPEWVPPFQQDPPNQVPLQRSGAHLGARNIKLGYKT